MQYFFEWFFSLNMTFALFVVLILLVLWDVIETRSRRTQSADKLKNNFSEPAEKDPFSGLTGKKG